MSSSSFTRWQEKTITQFSQANSLLLGLSTASLGFAISLLNSEKFEISSYWGRWIFIFAGMFLLTSIGVGIWSVVNRLRDFRLTAQIVQLREKNENNNEVRNNLKQMRLKARNLGKWTWLSFWVQIGSFFLGVLALSIVIICSSLWRKIS